MSKKKKQPREWEIKRVNIIENLNFSLRARAAIKWMNDWPLSEFHQIVFPMGKNKGKHKINPKIQKGFHLRILSDLTIFRYYFIYTSLNRIDENAKAIVKKDLTPYSIEEQIKNNARFEYFISDIVSLFIFSKIFMDKMAKFLHTFTLNGPSDHRYKKWVDDVNTFDSTFEELKEIIRESNEWYESLRNIRNDNIVHRAFSVTGFEGYSDFAIRLYAYNDKKGVKLTLKDVITLEKNMFDYLYRINRYFCDHVENLPFRLR